MRMRSAADFSSRADGVAQRADVIARRQVAGHGQVRPDGISTARAWAGPDPPVAGRRRPHRRGVGRYGVACWWSMRRATLWQASRRTGTNTSYRLNAKWFPSTECTLAPGSDRASSSWRQAGIRRSWRVTTTAVGISVSLWVTAAGAETPA